MIEIESILDYRSDPVGALEQCLSRIETREGAVQAFTVIATDAAREAARESAKRRAAGQPLSAIDGMVFGIKDVIETSDMPTAQGSPMWTGFQSRRDAAAVAALREAGAIILGKCTTAEFAFTEPLHGTRNPHDLERTPGGSSSGSAAAVAAGFVHAALGTQVVGSTLRPASYCGCVGFKPTFGALNRSGSYDHLSQSCIGVFATSVDDIAEISQAISASVGGDPGCKGYLPRPGGHGPAKPDRLAVLKPAGWSTLSHGTLAAFDAACQRLADDGIEIVASTDHAELANFEAMLESLRERTFAILDWELRWPLKPYRAAAPDLLSKALLERLARCEATMTLSDYHDALDWREGLRWAFGDLRDFDAFLLPSATGAAPLGLGWTGDPAMNLPASTLGAPAISLPLLQDEQLPLGIQLVGHASHDAELLSHARWLEARLSAP